MGGAYYIVVGSGETRCRAGDVTSQKRLGWVEKAVRFGCGKERCIMYGWDQVELAVEREMTL